jgi:hypothetical protein
MYDGKHCRWCQTTVWCAHVRLRIGHLQIHTCCAAQFSPECTLGPLAYHLLAPTSICPSVLVCRLRTRTCTPVVAGSIERQQKSIADVGVDNCRLSKRDRHVRRR